jgi:16S rRNA (uracil1498-N3)-methyltransferase
MVTGEEAKHAARVKRLEVGDRLEVLDGRGGVAEATIAGIEKVRDEWRLRLEVSRVSRVDPVKPRVEVLSAAPKGPRLGDLIDGLSQAGAASWAPLHSEYAQAEPREAKLERLERTAAEASKQCGRAWLLEIGQGSEFAAAVRSGPVVFADASGGPYKPIGAPRVILMVGPEGGWSPRELALAREAGVAIASFGPHVMRLETAAVVATGVILDSESRAR